MFLIVGLFGNPFNSPRTRDSTASPEPPRKQGSISGNPSPSDPANSDLRPSRPFSSSSSSLSLSSFTHSAAAPSAPQLSRSTVLSHNSAHTRTHARLPAVSHTAHRVCLYRVRLLPGNGRCSSGVSEQRRRVLLIGDPAGSPPLLLFLSQEPSPIDASIRDLKTPGQDITCVAFVIFGGTERS